MKREGVDMKAIDMHSHWSTKKGYLWRTHDEVKHADKRFRIKTFYRTEEEMAKDLRKADIKTVLDFGFTIDVSSEELRELHDYAGQFMRGHPDVVLGWWVCLDPRTGLKGLRELERCLKDLGAIGFIANPTGLGIPPTDPVFYPFYEMCSEAKAMVTLCVGFTAAGAGYRGGQGLLLEHCHPRYVDEVAAKFPDLTIIAARTAWPWEREMIAVTLHKTNVWFELHGWPPKYFAPELRWDISRRLQDRVLFGADYPLFDYSRLFSDWESEDYTSEILRKIYYENAQSLFQSLGRNI
jgi:hypothetical protein